MTMLFHLFLLNRFSVFRFLFTVDGRHNQGEHMALNLIGVYLIKAASPSPCQLTACVIAVSIASASDIIASIKASTNQRRAAAAATSFKSRPPGCLAAAA